MVADRIEMYRRINMYSEMLKRDCDSMWTILFDLGIDISDSSSLKQASLEKIFTNDSYRDRVVFELVCISFRLAVNMSCVYLSENWFGKLPGTLLDRYMCKRLFDICLCKLSLFDVEVDSDDVFSPPAYDNHLISAKNKFYIDVSCLYVIDCFYMQNRFFKIRFFRDELLCVDYIWQALIISSENNSVYRFVRKNVELVHMFTAEMIYYMFDVSREDIYELCEELSGFLTVPMVCRAIDLDSLQAVKILFISNVAVTRDLLMYTISRCAYVIDFIAYTHLLVEYSSDYELIDSMLSRVYCEVSLVELIRNLPLPLNVYVRVIERVKNLTNLSKLALCSERICEETLFLYCKRIGCLAGGGCAAYDAFNLMMTYIEYVSARILDVLISYCVSNDRAYVKLVSNCLLTRLIRKHVSLCAISDMKKRIQRNPKLLKQVSNFKYM